MEFLSSAVDIIVLISALCIAVTNIYKFFANGTKGIQRRVDTAREEQEQEFNRKVDERVREIV